VKKYKVNLLDKEGAVVLSHNLLALNENDAKEKAQACVSSVLDKSVVGFELV